VSFGWQASLRISQALKLRSRAVDHTAIPAIEIDLIEPNASERPRSPAGPAFAQGSTVSERQQRFVYLLRSERDNRPYVGITRNVTQRLATHNSGGSLYTAPHRPWRLVVALEFGSEETARCFERYLKSGSGRVFAKRHFV
jgi:putative endonuclease